MMGGMRNGLALGALACLVAGCASIMGKTESEVAIRTNPPQSRCEISGREGFRASVVTPATVMLPTAAAPLAVTCTAPGHRPTTYSLNTNADGWMWGNGALMAVTGGVAIIGALVDSSRDAGQSYSSAVSFDLDRDSPRLVRMQDRSGGVAVDARAR